MNGPAPQPAMAPQRLEPPGAFTGFVKNGMFHGAGLAALALTSLRHRVGGYRAPTAFSSDDVPRAVEHVLDIVLDWHKALGALGSHPDGFRGCDVLELGPGATLGTGVLLAGLGIRSYLAVDRFPLASNTPGAFYGALGDSALPSFFDRARVRAAAQSVALGRRDLLTYAAEDAFDIRRAVDGRRFDIIVSNAAFEHFSDIDAVIAQAAEAARPGAAFIAMVDFQTHTRGIRENDPNGIYRFGSRTYRLLAYPGQPNRQRPDDYLRALAEHGWTDGTIQPVDVAGPDYLGWSEPGLDPAFARPEARMEVLTGIVMARKASA